MPDIQTQLAPLTSDDFRQDQTRVCTIMAFLIGVDWQKCSFYYEQEEQVKGNVSFEKLVQLPFE